MMPSILEYARIDPDKKRQLRNGLLNLAKDVTVQAHIKAKIYETLSNINDKENEELQAKVRNSHRFVNRWVMEREEEKQGVE